MDGSAIVVNEARPMTDRPRRTGGFNRGSAGSGGRGFRRDYEEVSNPNLEIPCVLLLVSLHSLIPTVFEVRTNIHLVRLSMMDTVTCRHDPELVFRNY